MSDPGRQLSHRFQLLCLPELHLEGASLRNV